MVVVVITDDHDTCIQLVMTKVDLEQWFPKWAVVKLLWRGGGAVIKIQMGRVGKRESGR